MDDYEEETTKVETNIEINKFDFDDTFGPKTFPFENVTRRNVFTTRGRCGPGDTVMLPTEEAEQYFGKLKPCRT